MSSVQLDASVSSFSEDAESLNSSDESVIVDDLFSESRNDFQWTLASYKKIADNSQFVWGDLDGDSFSSFLDQVCKEIVHWRRNIFPLPTGRSGKVFVAELSRLFDAHIQAVVSRVLN